MENKYILEMSFCAQDNYEWTIVPSGFNYNAGVYQYRTIFNSQAEIIKWCDHCLPVLINSFKCQSSNYNYVLDYLSELGYQMKTNEKYANYYVDHFGVFISFKPCKYQDNKIPFLTNRQKYIIFREQDREYRYSDLCNIIDDRELVFTDQEINEGVNLFYDIWNMELSENDAWDIVIAKMEEKKNA